MFFSKSSSILALLVLALDASAHAAFEPSLGVAGTTARSDVQRPRAQTPCGRVNVADAIAASTPVAASGDTLNIVSRNFNGGRDGSRAIAQLSLDTTGTGTSFQPLDISAVTKNGEAAPTSTGTDQITVKLPAGTTCTGTCLLSVSSPSGFGNCVPFTTGGAGAGVGTAAAGKGAAVAGAAAAPDAVATGAAAAATGTAAAATATGATAASAAGTGNGNGNNNRNGNCNNGNGNDAGRNPKGAGRGNDNANANGNANGAAAGAAGAAKNKRRFVPVGTRAPRALRALGEMEQLS